MDVGSLSVQTFPWRRTLRMQRVMRQGQSRLSWLVGHHRWLVLLNQCCQLAEISRDIRPMLSVSRVTWHSTHVVIVVSLSHIWGWSDGTMTMMDSSPRVERFSTVTAGDGSATLLYAYHTKRCPSTSPLVFVNTTTMWDPDIYRWYMFAQRQN